MESELSLSCTRVIVASKDVMGVTKMRFHAETATPHAQVRCEPRHCEPGSTAIPPDYLLTDHDRRDNRMARMAVTSVRAVRGSAEATCALCGTSAMRLL